MTANATGATEVTLAAELVAWLSGGEFSKSLAFERTYLPEEELAAGVTGGKVHIFPRDKRSEAATNCVHLDTEIDVSIVLRAKLPPDDAAGPIDAIDDWMRVRTEIEQRLWDPGFGEQSNFTLLAVETNPIYAADHLKTYNQFTAVIVATYQLTTEPAQE